MALNTDKTLKTYYSIHEVALQFGVAESLLRYWESEFPSINPKKTGRNVRQYTREDIEEIRVVYNLLKVRGMRIAVARDALSKNKKATNDSSALIDELLNLKQELQALKKEISDLR